MLPRLVPRSFPYLIVGHDTPIFNVTAYSSASLCGHLLWDGRLPHASWKVLSQIQLVLSIMATFAERKLTPKMDWREPVSKSVEAREA